MNCTMRRTNRTVFTATQLRLTEAMLYELMKTMNERRNRSIELDLNTAAWKYI